MEACFGRVGNAQLVVSHTIALSQQNAPSTRHENSAGKIAGSNKRSEICVNTIGDLSVRKDLSSCHCAQKEYACKLRATDESFHPIPIIGKNTLHRKSLSNSATPAKASVPSS